MYEIAITIPTHSCIFSDKNVPNQEQETIREFLKSLCNENKFQHSRIIEALSRIYEISIYVNVTPDKPECSSEQSMLTSQNTGKQKYTDDAIKKYAVQESKNYQR